MNSHGPMNSHPLPLLDRVEVASPCHVAWDDMTGDDRARFCRHCRLEVYNLSDMTREQAEEFVASREGRTCVRLFRRADGTVLTRDCPVGLRLLRQRLVRSVAAFAGLIVALVTGSLFAGRLRTAALPHVNSPSTAYAEWIEPGSTMQMPVMGVMLCPPTPAPRGVQQQIQVEVLEPAESPLPPPTPEQLRVIQQRLAE
jgi:hypothetical protein